MDTPPKSRIVAIGLLTQHDLRTLGPTFSRAWPVDETAHFDDLLQAIDKAESSAWRRHVDSTD